MLTLSCDVQYYSSVHVTVSFGLLQREVVDSILHGNANKYTFDAKDVVFQVSFSL